MTKDAALPDPEPTDHGFRRHDRGWAEATQLVRGGLARTSFDETSEAIFTTSGYVYNSAAEAEAAFAGDFDRYLYSRYGNPTATTFEERLRILEGAEVCRATPSGMAAVFAALASSLSAGDRLVSSRALFGSCAVIVNEILPRYGVVTETVDGRDLAAWEAALAQGAQAVFLESPSNPALELVDIVAVAELAHAAGAIVVVDNVFATPLLQKPLALGADVVVYSATKHIDGQGRTMGGAVLCSQQFDDEHLREFIRHTGPTISPFNAWVMAKGLETLQLRVEAQSASALRIAQALETMPGIRSVLYPHLDSHPQVELGRRQMKSGSTLVALILDSPPDRAKESTFRFLDGLQIIDICNNLGDTKSLITHPATTTHRRVPAEQRAELGITDSLVRLSVGLEDPEDLIHDLEAALKASASR